MGTAAQGDDLDNMHARYYNPDIARFSVRTCSEEIPTARRASTCLRMCGETRSAPWIPFGLRRYLNQMGEFCLSFEACVPTAVLPGSSGATFSWGSFNDPWGWQNANWWSAPYLFPAIGSSGGTAAGTRFPADAGLAAKQPVPTVSARPGGPRIGPDYESVAVCAGPSVGICLTWTTDRVGRRYFNFAVGYGKSWPLATVSLVEGTFDTRRDPEGLANDLDGWGFNYGLGALLGFNRSYSLPSLTGAVERSTVFGAQAGIAGGYTWGPWY